MMPTVSSPSLNQPSSAQNDSSFSLFSRITYFYTSFSIIMSYYLDKSTIYPKLRWLFFLASISFFVYRVFSLQGFYLVAYSLGLHLLSMFLGFITPQDDPENENYVLPLKEDTGEFRPFIRRLPEFKFWLSITKATLLADFLTFFKIFDFGVFWPLLLFYFLILLFITIRQQIAKMIKYKYIPFSWGKKSYSDITRGGPPTSNPHGKSGWSNLLGGSKTPPNSDSSSRSGTYDPQQPQYSPAQGSTPSYIAPNINLHQPGNNVKLVHNPSQSMQEIPNVPTVAPPPRHYPTRSYINSTATFAPSNSSLSAKPSNSLPWSSHGSSAKYSKSH